MLPVKDKHFETYNNIDFDEAHCDPFDHHILASAHFENMAIITKDEKSNFIKISFKSFGNISQS